MQTRIDGFCPDGRLRIDGTATGPLAGLTFAVKDVIDLAGWPTSAGNPDWQRTHPLPTTTAPCVQALIDSGASVVGKTILDEMCASMSGINVHYGTPINPAAPDHLPGGSSSGSAAVVGAGLCDFALGTDTSGSVRLPAAYCGVFGYRPSHGRIDASGVVPLAPSFDTVGLVASSAAALEAVARCSLRSGAREVSSPARTLLVAVDVLGCADAQVQEVISIWLRRVRGRFDAIRLVEAHGGDLYTSFQAHCTLVAHECQAIHQPWIDAVRPTFGPDVGNRFRPGEGPPPAEEVATASRVRDALRARTSALVGPETVVLLPSTFTVPPPVETPLDALTRVELLSIACGCLASLTGLPQVTAPWASANGLPVGVSLLGPQNGDEGLLALVREIDEALDASTPSP